MTTNSLLSHLSTTLVLKLGTALSQLRKHRRGCSSIIRGTTRRLPIQWLVTVVIETSSRSPGSYQEVTAAKLAVQAQALSSSLENFFLNIYHLFSNVKTNTF